MNTITVPTKNLGPQKVKVVYRAGHFAVHRSIAPDHESSFAKLWTVTHIPTGRAITTYCKSRKEAREIARWIKATFEECGLDAAEPDVKKIRSSAVAAATKGRLSQLERAFIESLPEETA